MFSLLLLMVARLWLTKNQGSFNEATSSVFVILRMIPLALVRVLLTLAVCGGVVRILGIVVRGKPMRI
jgi:hypothetical protein